MSEEKSKKSKEMVVTPWEVSGVIDYRKLVKKFGTTLLTEKEIKVLNKYSKGKLHLLLRRGLFFSHRDFDWILKQLEKGEKFVLYTGRGPSGHTHLGHLVPWIFTKWLQDIFDVELYFQMTDDEKFLFSQKLTFQETKDYAYENAKDVMAVGFDPKKTHFIFDSQLTSTMYQIAVEVAKRTTFSTAKAVFGFTNESNVGMIFYPSIQAMPCFLPSKLKGKNIPILIPAAIDQDPYWRITRDVAPKLGYYKPAAIHCKFFPGLAEGGKMSASEPDSCIFTTDTPTSASKKIMRSYTGGRATVEEQRELGGEPDKCNVYWYEYYLFEPDDKKIEEMRTNCLSGKLLCGQCKKILAEKVKTFVEEHQERRNKFTDEMIDKMIIKE
ncbi:MAG: tryptophan--tRNA ligase [Candidatus Heimdallarchaeota archaeon]|nr:MAG: tryptophan--tRNA ligase [Candidatus Heimdallarchaeota archaeon]